MMIAALTWLIQNHVLRVFRRLAVQTLRIKTTINRSIPGQISELPVTLSALLRAIFDLDSFRRFFDFLQFKALSPCPNGHFTISGMSALACVQYCKESREVLQVFQLSHPSSFSFQSCPDLYVFIYLFLFIFYLLPCNISIL